MSEGSEQTGHALGLAGNHLDWTRETTCPTCHGPAVYKRDKRRKISLNCANCGPLKYQANGGQALMEKRLRKEVGLGGTLAGVVTAGDSAAVTLAKGIKYTVHDSEISETAPEKPPEQVPEFEATEQAESEPPAKPQRRRWLAGIGSAALVLGGVAWLVKTQRKSSAS